MVRSALAEFVCQATKTFTDVHKHKLHFAHDIAHGSHSKTRCIT